jgi:hypothetical protein
MQFQVIKHATDEVKHTKGVTLSDQRPFLSNVLPMEYYSVRKFQSTWTGDGLMLFF